MQNNNNNKPKGESGKNRCLISRMTTRVCRLPIFVGTVEGATRHNEKWKVGAGRQEEDKRGHGKRCQIRESK